MKWRVVALLLLLALPASAQDGARGTWSGHYTCAQGNTALSLTITPLEGSRVSALFHFEAPANNPGVPTGCFEMLGDFDPASARLELRPWRWLHRPPGWVMVGIDGQIGADGLGLTGTVRGPGCTVFALTRREAPGAAKSCRAGGALLSLR